VPHQLLPAPAVTSNRRSRLDWKNAVTVSFRASANPGTRRA